ncbi:hypothetical protein [Pseudooceanicola sp. LIPI14-2-Ac024]|uniref:hypothetical protein n=1 Tax=Pseudooceanicola sp. LIPI14-2-Ac024 TaxID=3344875 RepID=UPI0035D0C24C
MARFGRGINNRLQGYVPEFGQTVANAFDLTGWKQGAAFGAFGCELFVERGSVTVSLRHVSGDGETRELCRLEQHQPGSVFSPPILAHDMDGFVLPVIEDTSLYADFDIHFGTNDAPPQPHARIGLILDRRGDVAGAEQAVQAYRAWRDRHGAGDAIRLLILADDKTAGDMPRGEGVEVVTFPGLKDVSPLGWALFDLLYSRFDAPGFSHLGLVRQGIALHPEMFARALAYTRFLRPGIQLGAALADPGGDALPGRIRGVGLRLDGHRTPGVPIGAGIEGTDLAALAQLDRGPDHGGWTWQIIDTRDLHRLGLPLPFAGDLASAEHAMRFERGGVGTVVPMCLWGMEPAPKPSLLQKVTGTKAAPPRGPRRQNGSLSRLPSGDAALLQSSIPAWTRIAGGAAEKSLPRAGSDEAAQMLERHRELAILHDRMERQHRAALQGAAAQIAPLRTALDANRLLDPESARGDLERASRTMLSLLRNRHAGARVFVIGNGPSLHIADLDRLRDAVTLASNKIYLAYDETDWRPTYYSVEDHLVMLNNRDRIAALTDSIKIFPASLRDFGYHAGDTVFMPFRPPASFEDPLSDPDFPAFSDDLAQGVCWGSTILYTQIQIAVHLGAAEIVLIGLDHSYDLPDTRDGNTYLHAGERNHFHPDYRAPGERWHQPNLEVLEASYARARQVCEARGIRIVNASRETRLDVFDRADLDTLLPGGDA